MAVTRTFSIIKPDATRRNITGAVTKMLEEAGLRVVAAGGGLGGFNRQGGGFLLEVKRWLLRHEGIPLDAPAR